MSHYRPKTLRALVSVVMFVLLYAGISLAQVTVAPTLVFIDARSSTGNLYVSNNSASAQEVGIDFAFGYPDADSAGNGTMNYTDSLAAKTYSLNPFIKAYPRTFLLQPKQQQVVRMQVRAKGDAKNVFYFTRIKVTSMAKTADIETKTTEGVTTQVNFKFDQILPLFYHKGVVTTGLAVHSVRTSMGDKKMTVIADLERTGSAPFIGSIKAVLYSAANLEVARFEGTASIFFSMKHKVDLDLSTAGKGPHRLVLTYETRRADAEAKELIQSAPVTKEISVNIQ